MDKNTSNYISGNPYTRRVISVITKDTEFQPMMLEYIDFSELHNRRKTPKEALTSKNTITN